MRSIFKNSNLDNHVTNLYHLIIDIPFIDQIKPLVCVIYEMEMLKLFMKEGSL